MNDMRIRLEGKVKAWDSEKGFGFILTNLGDYYTHISCTKDHKDLKPGQRVRFCVESSEYGLIGKNVEVI